jgi:hypothetical protein
VVGDGGGAERESSPRHPATRLAVLRAAALPHELRKTVGHADLSHLTGFLVHLAGAGGSGPVVRTVLAAALDALGFRPGPRAGAGAVPADAAKEAG